MSAETFRLGLAAGSRYALAVKRKGRDVVMHQMRFVREDAYGLTFRQVLASGKEREHVFDGPEIRSALPEL